MMKPPVFVDSMSADLTLTPAHHDDGFLAKNVVQYTKALIAAREEGKI
jgi:hypothetical protein